MSRAIRAFTIVELLVSIGVIAVLVGLLGPALLGAKQSARFTASLANLRSHASNVALYSSDFQDHFPYFTDPAATYTVLRAGGVVWPVRYFDVYCSWNFPMVNYYEGNIAHPSMAVFPDRPSHVMESYEYSSCLVARPEFWLSEKRTGPEQWGATRVSEAIFAAKKAVFVTRGAYTHEVPVVPDQRRAMGFVDGHAAWILPQDQMPVYSSGEGGWPGSWFNGGMIGLHTIDGVRGRDAR